MPRYKPRYALSMTPEQANLSNKLAIIHAALRNKRASLIEQLAAEKGVSTRTVRRWITKHEEDRGAILRRAGRSDKGKFRMPQKTYERILTYFWENPDASVRAAHAYLIENYKDDMFYTGRNGKERLVSVASVQRIKAIFRKGWDSEVRRTGSLV